MFWEVRGKDGAFVVEGEHWLAAVHAATERLGLPENVEARIVADVQASGVLRIHDPKGSLRLLARLLPDTFDDIHDLDELDDLETEDMRTAETEEAYGVAVSKPAPVSMTAPKRDEAAISADELDLMREAALSAVQPLDVDPLMNLHSMPTHIYQRSIGGPVQDLPAAPTFSPADLDTLLEHVVDLPAEDEDTSDLIEELFLRSAGIASAEDAADAAQQALTLLLEIIPAQDAAVLFAGVNAEGLEFLAYFGPKATALSDTVLPFGSGLAGYCFDTGKSVLVSRALAPPTASVAEHTASSGSVLAVPVRDDDGHTWGVIEMLDAPLGFETWQLHAAENVAVTLAQYMLSQSTS